jgi:ATP-dependent DNA helicase 2 subunit 1
MKAFGEPSLLLLGFKPISSLKFKHNVEASLFITPKDRKLKGSSEVFAELVTSLHEQRKVAICKLIARKTSILRLVALIPQLSQKTMPLGFQLIYLPFADDIRHFDDDIAPITVKANTADSMITCMDAIIDSLALPTLNIVSNPELSKFKAGLDSVALDLDDMEVIVDETLPNLDWIQDVAGDLIAQLNGDDFLKESRKRAATTCESTAGKRTKLLPTHDEIVESYKRGKLNDFTVPQLMDYLKSISVVVKSKKKADLVQLLTRQLDGQTL